MRLWGVGLVRGCAFVRRFIKGGMYIIKVFHQKSAEDRALDQTITESEWPLHFKDVKLAEFEASWISKIEDVVRVHIIIDSQPNIPIKVFNK